jgi:hypothetical protein
MNSTKQYTKIIVGTEYSMHQIRGPDYLRKAFEHMIRSFNAGIESAFAECAQDSSRRIRGIEAQWCVDVNPMRNPDGDVAYWKLIVKVEEPA